MTPKAYTVVFLVPHTRPTHRLTSVELPARACLQLTLQRHSQRSSVTYSPGERALLTAEMPAQQQGANSATLHFSTPWLFTSPSAPGANLFSLLGSSTQPLKKTSVNPSFPPSLPSFRLKNVSAGTYQHGLQDEGFSHVHPASQESLSGPKHLCPRRKQQGNRCAILTLSRG